MESKIHRRLVLGVHRLKEIWSLCLCAPYICESPSNSNNNNSSSLILKDWGWLHKQYIISNVVPHEFFFSIHSNIIIYQFVSLDATHPFLLLSSTSPSVLNSLNLINTSILKITFFFHLFFLKSTLKQTPLPHIFPWYSKLR